VTLSGPITGMGFAIARRVARHWLANVASRGSPLGTRTGLRCSARILYTAAVGAVGAAMLNRFLKPRAAAPRPPVNTARSLNASAARKR